MNVLITYDMSTVDKQGQKRLRDVAKACKDFGQRVQNSVFECELSEAQLTVLELRLSEVINDTLDSIRIYNLGKNAQKTKILGKITSHNFNDSIII